MEKRGLTMRLQSDITPEVYKCATITKVRGVVRRIERCTNAPSLPT
jgi:hypothetical protein